MLEGSTGRGPCCGLVRDALAPGHRESPCPRNARTELPSWPLRCGSSDASLAGGSL